VLTFALAMRDNIRGLKTLLSRRWCCWPAGYA